MNTSSDREQAPVSISFASFYTSTTSAVSLRPVTALQNASHSTSDSAYHVTTSLSRGTGSHQHPVTVRQGVVYALICMIAVVCLSLLLCAVRYNRKRRHGFLHVRPTSIESTSTSPSSCEVTPGIIPPYRGKKDDSRHILNASLDDTNVALPRLTNLSNITLDWPTPLYKKIDAWTPTSVKKSEIPSSKERLGIVTRRLGHDDVSCPTRLPNGVSTIESQPTNSQADETLTIATCAKVHLVTPISAEISQIECSYEKSIADSATSTPISAVNM